MSEYTQWCQMIFNGLVEGGVWGVPRSGLIFRKEGDSFVLVEVAPPTEDLPMNAEELRLYQQFDYDGIKMVFEEAGIHVRSEVEL